nr:hypothetical protein Iba_chr06bCG11450 [Ipomoea batatas]
MFNPFFLDELDWRFLHPTHPRRSWTHRREELAACRRGAAAAHARGRERSEKELLRRAGGCQPARRRDTASQSSSICMSRPLPSRHLFRRSISAEAKNEDAADLLLLSSE